MRISELRREEEYKRTIVIPDEALVKEYCEYRQQLEQMTSDFREVVTHPTYSLPFLQSGRLVKVKHLTMDFGWGIVINYQKRLPPKVTVQIIDFSYLTHNSRVE
jgi:ATP-dependent RNA helicase DOB1